ncbi:Dbl homology domain-containing protein [Radiomyces spectabilis]|uniref:Dbl homology domain-containing protein n=1 Tax=Radiomyces spectabilis TaxID=64574 RepID=UPI00221F3FC7|nr:Dbl homology domain-containing protein [Radiomyces spectabilis]KAI8388319.1 Dbl homology domain-containing protein [Radiomyces spectabilis]
MTELLSTEATYLDHLMIIKKEFMNPLHSAAKQRPRPLVRMEDVEVIFAFIPQLIILSTALFCRLHDTIHYATEHSGQGIGRVFCDLEDQFAVYIFYAVNFSKLQKCLAKTADNIVYRQLVQNSLRKKETNRMGLSDYMIAPIQRITRYCLLLKDLKKRTSPSHLDYPYLDRALKSLSALAWAMNDIQ